MRKAVWATALIGAAVAFAPCQIRHTSIPLGDAVSKALAKSFLTGREAHPFHVRISISEPENPQAPYQGTIEEWWVSKDQWRREVTAKGGMRQVIVVAAGSKTEEDEGDYFPLRLRSFVGAVFDPIPDAKEWSTSGLTIEQITLPNGAKSNPCVRAKSKIGSGDRATDAFSNICFDADDRLEFYGSPRYSMEFKDYHSFGKLHIAHRLVDHPEPGTEIVGEVTQIEDLSKANLQDFFTPFKTKDDLFRSLPVGSEQLEKLSSDNPPIAWPSVRSGNLRGHLAVYISVDREGRVREAWPLNSDNAGLNDSVREQIRTWKMHPAVDSSGNRVQIDGGLGFYFETKIGDPLPELGDAEVRQLATNAIEPNWPSGSVKPGDIVEIEISVSEQGKLTGVGSGTASTAAQLAAYAALRQWIFHPLIRDGKPEYFHGKVKFPVH